MCRVDGMAFHPAVTTGAQFFDRPALAGFPAQQSYSELPSDGCGQVRQGAALPGGTSMTRESCDILVTSTCHQQIMEHLFPGDREEYGAILRAGVVRIGSSMRLLVQHVQPAEFGTDYVPGKYGHRALTPTFIHREILQCRDSGLAYLAVHNHGSGRHVGFSRVDIESHERGYPALLDIGRGVPVGALVYGRRSVAADIWLPDGNRRSLGTYRIIGNEISRLYSQPRRARGSNSEHDRQVRMFGAAGQQLPESEQGSCHRAWGRRFTGGGIPCATWGWEPSTHRSGRN